MIARVLLSACFFPLLLSAEALGLTVDVKQAGAVGDGVADDTAALQRALDGGGRTVVIPEGIYKIGAALKVDSSTTIQAAARATIRLADRAGNDAGLFLVTNRDHAGGNREIVIHGGVWDGNNEHNARGSKEELPCFSGVALNFINVRGLTLKNLTVRNPDSYAIRACRLDHFVFEDIGFDFSVTRPNQDGVHLNGFCEHGVIRRLRALSPYATNDDMVALNADDGTGKEWVMQQDMVCGPIRDITVEDVRAESAFTFVRLLSSQSPIENVTISDISGGCRFYAVNMDRWRFPEGGGKIRNVTLRNFSVQKMPDDFSTQARAAERPLIHIQSAVEGFEMENFRRPDGDVAAATLVLDNGQQNRLQLDGLTPEQEAELRKLSPEVTAEMFHATSKPKRALELNARARVVLPAGGFSRLKLDSGAVAAADRKGQRETFTASETWRPIQWEPARIVKGSALDFSTRLEAPAGKFGEVFVQGDHFAFKNAPEKPVRLYGVVVSHALPYLDKARCEQLADYLAATGYSAVRLHNYNFAKGVMKEIGSAEFTPEAQDQLDYFLFCLKQRGIYFSFPLNAWGFFKAGDVTDVPEFRGRAFRFESNGLLPISADLQRWFKAYATRLLGHINRYTGLALKDEPALLSIELTNENALLSVLGQYPELVPIYRRLCGEGLRTALGHEPTAEEVEKALPGYVLELQEKFFHEMQRFLREAGVRQPLTDLNFRDNMVYALPRSQLDYVDIHAYWALYKTLPGAKTGHEALYRQTWQNPNTIGWGYYLGPVPARLFAKPYVNTEFNGCYATPYWSFTGPVEAVLAATQGWNAVHRCGLAADAGRFFKATPIRQIGTSASPVMMLSERIGAALFAEGEVPPLPVRVPFVVTPEYLRSHADSQAGPKYPPSYARLAFAYQLGTVLLDGTEKLDGFPCFVAPEGMALPASLAGRKVLRADAQLAKHLEKALAGVPQPDTPRLQLDAGTGAGQIVTPRSETLLLPAEAGEARGRSVRIAGNDSVSVCFVGSLDGRELAAAERILALYLTDVKNTGTEVEYEARQNVVVRNSGSLPLLVRQGKITVSLPLAAERPLPEVWALKYDGSRAVQITPRRTPEGYTFDAQAVTNSETFSAFEIVWSK